MMLALNINAGLSPDKECPTVEQSAPHPIVACGPGLRSRPERDRPPRTIDLDAAHIILINGEKQ